jgi:hypothetical protein
MGADQLEPRGARRVLDDPDHRRVQRLDAAERPLLPCLPRDPRRVLEHAAEARHERFAVQAVGCVDRDDRRRLYIAPL